MSFNFVHPEVALPQYELTYEYPYRFTFGQPPEEQVTIGWGLDFKEFSTDNLDEASLEAERFLDGKIVSIGKTTALRPVCLKETDGRHG